MLRSHHSLKWIIFSQLSIEQPVALLLVAVVVTDLVVVIVDVPGPDAGHVVIVVLVHGRVAQLAELQPLAPRQHLKQSLHNRFEINLREPVCLP